GDTVRTSSFAADTGGEYAVFLEAREGAVQLIVLDSEYHQSVASVSASPRSGPLDENASANFQSPGGGVYLLRAQAFPSTAAARFRFMVYGVNRAPELGPAAFSIGDTVSGEVIEPRVDADEFVTHGEAGQEVVAVAEALAPAGSGVLNLVVRDPGTRDLLGYVLADAGSPARFTTGRIKLPTSRDYQFDVRGALGNFSRYHRPPGLFAHATGRFTVAQGGSYVARVTGTDSHFLADTRSYRFFLYPVDRRPEHVPAAIAPGDTVVGEAIDMPGDVDEFTFSGAAGE